MSTRLQSRDLDILHSLSIARFLTAQELEWLHYPAWRSIYKAHYEQAQKGQESHYRPAPNFYRRMAQLRSCDLVRVVARRSDAASVAITRLPDIYTLTRAGAALLSEQRGLDLNELWVEPVRQRAVQNLEHSLAIGQVYAALRAACEHRQHAALGHWQGDHLLARPAAYDRLPVVGYRERLPVQPDATALLTTANGARRLFLELDRGTRPLSTWREKTSAYTAYVGNKALQVRYGCDDFLLLIVAPTLQRLTHIAEEVVKVTRQPQARYQFLLTEHVHPTTIRAYGQRVAQVAWSIRKLPHGLVELPTVTLQPAALWPSQ